MKMNFNEKKVNFSTKIKNKQFILLLKLVTGK